jgi:hypothetical protein
MAVKTLWPFESTESDILTVFGRAFFRNLYFRYQFQGNFIPRYEAGRPVRDFFLMLTAKADTNF